MHTYASVASLVLAIGARMAFSAALPDRPVFEGCGQDYGSPDQTKYTISNKVAAPGPPVTGSFSCVGSDTGCTLQDSETYSVGVTVTVGLGLNLDPEKIAGNAGITASVATDTTTGTIQGASKNCPIGPWTCALIITPAMTEVSGTQSQLTSDCQTVTGSSHPYTIQYPNVGKNGLQGGSIDICACTNKPHATDPGAPSVPCPQPCKP